MQIGCGFRSPETLLMWRDGILPRLKLRVNLSGQVHCRRLIKGHSENPPILLSYMSLLQFHAYCFKRGPEDR